MKMTIYLSIPPQDAHELFHVLTSSLEEEQERQPRVAHLFDVQTLEVNKSTYHSINAILGPQNSLAQI